LADRLLKIVYFRNTFSKSSEVLFKLLSKIKQTKFICNFRKRKIFKKKTKTPGLIGKNLAKSRENMKFGKTAYF
jgi:hypothetical protein